MKIVFIGGRDLKSLGGIENYMLNLATQLVKMGHTPIVFCESDHNGSEVINGFKVIHQKGFKSNLICKPWLGLKATLKVILYHRDTNVIHYNAWPPSLWSPIARLFGFKCIMQGHGLEWQRSKYTPTQQRILKFMEWITAHINKNLIMCSEDQTRYFKTHYGKQVTTISTAINPPNLDTSTDNNILLHYGLKKKHYFLFLSRLVKDKNPDCLIKAFNMINDTNGFKLIIAGSNESNLKYVNSLHELAKDNSNIIFTGAVYGNDKEALLRNAAYYILPSTIEGLSISLLEAMSYKLPIIASNIPANKEILPEDNALWIEPENIDQLANAITKALNNPGCLDRATQSNYDFVINNYTWPQITAKYLKYLQSI